jgi:hypothetical protein
MLRLSKRGYFRKRRETMSEEEMARIRAVKDAHTEELMAKANVVGVGIGLRSCGGQLTGQPAIIVSVTHKVPRSDLAEQDILPSELDGVPVDVQAIGLPRAL